MYVNQDMKWAYVRKIVAFPTFTFHIVSGTEKKMEVKVKCFQSRKNNFKTK